MELAHTPLAPGMLLRLLNLPRRSVVHVHVAHAVTAELVWLASRLRGWPYIAQFHLDVDASGALGWLLPAYKRAVLGPILRSAAQVIVLSPEQADFVASTYRVDRQRLAVLPNGVGDEFFVERQRPTVVGAVGAQPLRLLYVGRLSPQKNVHRLLDAMELVVEPVELVLVGDGELRDPVTERVAGRPNVRMVGAQRGADLLEWYRWADAFVLASDKEGMPLVLLEAMAAGLAVVATDVPGSREIVGQAGLLAPPDPQALAGAIDKVAHDPALRAALAQAGIERARASSWRARMPELEALYQGAAS
jgi:phosphatidylinositol alpha-mannosyltransferase